MKNLLKLFAVVLVAGIFLSCGGNNATSKTSGPAAGQVIVGTTTEASGDWGYGTWTNNATDNTVLSLIDACYTVTTDLNGEYVWNNSVVESYKIQDNGDSKTWTIVIKDGLKFNNGEPITAKDFLTWTLFVASPAGKDLKATSSAYNVILGGDKYRSGEVKYLEGLRLLDKKTFSITVLATGYDGAKNLPFYYDLANASLAARNAKFWFGEGWTVKDDGKGAYLVNETDASLEFSAENVGDHITAVRYQSENRVSAGPYNLVGYDKSSYQITLEVNENYEGNFEGQKPGIKTLVITKVESNTVMDMLATGQIDMYEQITDGNDINAALDLIDNGTIDASYVRFDRAGYGKIFFVCDFGPTQFTGVRHAIAHLIDRVEFANTFCNGWGGIVNGPYGTAFSMAQDSEDLFAKELDVYEYSLEAAIAALEKEGFVLGADGNAYKSGIRYKEVTDKQAQYYNDTVLVGGKRLMPCIIKWASSEGNSVSDLIATMLQENPDLAAAGIKIERSVMTFPELLNYMYRQDAYNLGGDYSIPTYNMMNLATSWSAAAYDQSYEFTSDPQYLALGYNVTHIYDDQLDKLSMDMVYGVEAGDYKAYLDKWQKFIIRWNQMLPELPLYSNIYITVYPNTISGYQQTAFRTFQKAILYATWVGK